jgi:hypothetical protein
MTDKFEFYDILSVLIPGTLLLALMSVGFPALAVRFAAVKFPEAFGVICLVALAVFMGYVVQAISSLIEPLLEWTWGGRASEKALRDGLGTRYLPADTAKRIKQKLAACVGSAESHRSLFLYAVQRAETSGNSRVAKFNGLYAYHRAMFTLLFIGLVVLAAAMRWGGLSQWPTQEKIETLVGGVVLLLIIWRRAKQRGFYYVREVLLTAEHLIDSQQNVAQ